jgi:hypothetical protein
VADAVDTLAAAGGNALKLVHTHDGAAAACMALAYGTPKDRKRLVKGMKGEPVRTAWSLRTAFQVLLNVLNVGADSCGVASVNGGLSA